MQSVPDLNEDLAEVWLVMRNFCSLVNLATETQMLIQSETIYGTMIAVMYRLLSMGFATGTPNEFSRLGLLAFTHHVFLQWQDMRLPGHPFSDSYRHYLQLHALGNITPPQRSLWLLTIGAVSLFSIKDELWLADYLRAHLERCGVKTWEDGKEILESFMWISLLDDKSGKQVYDSIITLPSRGLGTV